MLALASLASVSGGCASADRVVLTSPTTVAPAAEQLVSLEIVSESGSLPAHLYAGSVFVEGRHGERYALRLTNNSAQRVEAVVTVDGRDVVSGELGNYNKQRGYIIEPWGTVMVDGYRQSLDRVAAFRFSELGDSYTARRGTAEHAGVVGVAVFAERQRLKAKKRQPVATTPPYYEPGVDYGGRTGEPFPEAAAADQERASSTRDGAFSPAPVPRNKIGTAYGESRTSVVHQTRFARRRSRRPDALMTVYYDSHEGLMARGVVPGPYYEPEYQPQPFNGPYAAPPPPVWR